MRTPEPKSAWWIPLFHLSPGGLCLIVIVFGIGCATRPGSKPAYREACFNPDRITSFTPLGESFAYIEVGDDEHYLLTLNEIVRDAELPLPGRPLSTGITITGRVPGTNINRVCRDSSPVADYMSGEIAVHKQIVHIEIVASKEEAIELAKVRSMPPTK